MLLASIILGALILISIRSLWINYRIEEYTFASLYYVYKTKQSLEVSQEMSELWPRAHMLTEMWRWDFRRYVVHQDHYEALQEFMNGEIQLSDQQLIDDLARRDEQVAQELDDHSQGGPAT